MNIPKAVSDRVAAIEHAIALVEQKAQQQVGTLRQQLEILDFAISAFAEDEHHQTPVAIVENVAPATLGDLIAGASLKERVFRIIASKGPISAKEIRAETGTGYHASGAIIGALSRTGRIRSDGGNLWEAR